MIFHRLFSRILPLFLVVSPVVSLVVAPSIAHADPATAKAEILVMHASQKEKGAIDPHIGSMPRLKQPPFSAYNNYELVDRKEVPLEIGKSATYALPNGRVLQLTVSPGKSPGLFTILASIAEANGKAALKTVEVSAKAGEPFFVAGQTYKDGILVLGIAVKK
jgi:hypothetical protein